MRSAERELAEMERKKQTADAMSTTSARPRSSADLNKERMVELTHQIGLEAKRLAATRGQLQRLKAANSTTAPNKPAAAPTSVVQTSSKDDSTAPPAAKKMAGSVAAPVASDAGGDRNRGGSMANTVPDGLLPELVK
jgi:hypothetical protein